MIQNVVTYTVVVKAENPDGLLLPGMTANIDFIENRRESVLIVPVAALRFTPPEAFLDKVNNKRPQGEKGNRMQTAGPERGKRNDPQGSPFKKRGNRAMLWLLSEDGSIEPVPVQTGITDGSRTGCETKTRKSKRIRQLLPVLRSREDEIEKSVSLLPAANARGKSDGCDNRRHQKNLSNG